MNRFGLASLSSLCIVGVLLPARVARATKSAELYTSTAYPYGRFEARMRFAAGDGVVSAFFLWKDGSEQAGTFWNELDYEKIGANCQLQTNALYGNPSANHTQKPTTSADLCGGFHVYGYEWTADYIAWTLDGAEIRRETGDTAAAYAQNATALQIHFNVWPGDSSFGGNFSPNILPVFQYIDWVQYSSYKDGAFTLAWREDFDGTTAPSGWLTGNWGSPKNLSTHDPLNVNFVSGSAVLSLTADDATGPAGAMPGTTVGMGGMGGTTAAGGTTGAAGRTASTGGTSGTAGMTASAGGAAGTSGGTNTGGSGGTVAAAGMSASGAAGGTGGTTALGGTSGTAATTGGTTGSGAASSTGGSGALGGGASGTATSGGTAGMQGGTPSGTGGTDANAVAPAAPSKKSDDANGCGCHVPGSTNASERDAGVGAVLLLALAGAFRRRPRSRA